MLTVLTHPFPTRPSSDLDSRRRDAIHITSPASEFGRIECLRHQWLGGYLLMPRVPVVTGNSVRLAPRPFAAVQPVQLDNAIAEGVQLFGAQLGATAETVAQIAENRARLDAKAADVDYSAFGSDALYDPENGFMNLGGKNALDA